MAFAQPSAYKEVGCFSCTKGAPWMKMIVSYREKHCRTYEDVAAILQKGYPLDKSEKLEAGNLVKTFQRYEYARICRECELEPEPKPGAPYRASGDAVKEVM